MHNNAGITLPAFTMMGSFLQSLGMEMNFFITSC